MLWVLHVFVGDLSLAVPDSYQIFVGGWYAVVRISFWEDGMLCCGEDGRLLRSDPRGLTELTFI